MGTQVQRWMRLAEHTSVLDRVPANLHEEGAPMRRSLGDREDARSWGLAAV